ncbi:MAG: CheY-like chemotaxis protein [Flavobacteriales bacterium]|jgi:CheY-like chemotaxis protein
MSEFIKLADDRIRVFAAESVEEAFQFLESANSFPEVIYVDINMPVQSGFEFIELYERRFRSAHPSSKLFMLSSTLRHEDKAQALEFESVSGFMSKNDIDTFLQKSLLKEFV